MMTRLSFSRSIITLHRPVPTLVPSIPSTLAIIGRLTNAHRGLTSAVTVVPTAHQLAMSRRDLTKELEDGIQPWTGPSVFSTSISLPRRDGTMACGGRSTSPISISSSSAESSPVKPARPPSQVNDGRRIRGVARYASPLPRTAYTPPKPKAASNEATIHPFFSGARSLPPPVPPSQRPRMVAHYSSTESSQSQTQSQGTQDSHSTFGEPSSSTSDRAVISTSAAGIKGKGKERAAAGPPAGWSEQDIEDMASRFGNVQITREPLKSMGGGRNAASVQGAPMVKNTAASSTTNGQPREPPPKKPMPIKTKSSIKSETKSRTASSSNTRWFQHSSCLNPPSIAYTTDMSEANDLVSSLKGDVFGFDLEWPPAGQKRVIVNAQGKEETTYPGRTWDAVNKKYVFKTGKTAMIQICDKHLVILIHMKDMKDLPEKVIELVQDPTKIKLGVQIGGDGTKLLKDYAPHLSRATSLLELTHLARRVDAEAIGPGNTLIALAKLTERYTGFPLRKEQDVRSGDWAATLNQEQKDYAANDVYASLLIYEKLVSLARERNINILPLRRFCSDKGDYRPPSSCPNSPGGSSSEVMFARRDAVTPSPSPSEARTISMFVEGKSTERIAIQMSVKHSTAQTYLASGIGKIHEDVLSEDDKRRFLIDVQDNIWVQRRHGEVLKRVRAELGEKPVLEVTDLSNEPDTASDTEGEEAVEEIEKN